MLAELCVLKRGRERVPPFVAGGEPKGSIDRNGVVATFQLSDNHQADADVVRDVHVPRREN